MRWLTRRAALPRASHDGTLASCGGTWQGTAMAEPTPSRSPIAGGALIALGALGGAVIGFIAGQPTPGLLIGLGTGASLSLLIWLGDRRRR